MKQSFSMSTFILLLLLAICLHAQEQVDTLSFKGKKALTFLFDGFNLKGGLGGKYWINNHYAMRIILTGSYYKTHNLISEASNNTSSFGATVYLNRHFYINFPLSPYLGVGGGLTQQYFVHSSGDSERYLYVAVPVLIGIEYWLTKEITLSGEQSIHFYLNTARNYRDYGFSNSTSSLLLSVYF